MLVVAGLFNINATQSNSIGVELVLIGTELGNILDKHEEANKDRTGF